CLQAGCGDRRLAVPRYLHEPIINLATLSIPGAKRPSLPAWLTTAASRPPKTVSMGLEWLGCTAQVWRMAAGPNHVGPKDIGTANTMISPRNSLLSLSGYH